MGYGLNRQDAKIAKDYWVGKRVEPDPELDQWARRVIGAAIAVHRALGPGFLESVYEEAMCIELTERGIPFIQQAPVAIRYKGRNVGEGKVDLLVADALIVELKTVDAIAPIHIAQVVSYLNASQLHLGLLLNFKSSLLKDGLLRIIRS